MRNMLHVIARLALSLVFISGGWIKIAGTENWIRFLVNGGIPAAGLVLFMIILVELGGGLMVLFGLQTRKATLLLLGLMGVETIVSQFSGLPETEFLTGISLISKNVAIMGGLLDLYLHAPGKWSVEALESMGKTCRKSLVNSHIRIV